MIDLPAHPKAPTKAYGLSAHGKWFRDITGNKVLWNGVTYGPFAPNKDGEPWPDFEQLQQDLRSLQELGITIIRIYELPTETVLRAAQDHGIGLLVTLPWSQHVDFLETPLSRARLVRDIVAQARYFQGRPEVVGVLVGNEIESHLVRWMGPEKVRSFLEEVIGKVKTLLPNTLVSYTTYPSTEYLIPRNADFVAFNLFLESETALRRYLQRLQVLAEGRPLVITEFGLDSLRHGEEAQAACRKWSTLAFLEAEVAGYFWFSFTDEWHRGGELVTDWAFGLVDAERRPKRAFERTPLRPKVHLDTTLKISVIVCTCNGSATLRGCLQALQRQTYSNFEVWIIDDGSTEPIQSIAKEFPEFDYRRQEHAGLSVARNLGCELATGEILAYTDDDCLPDENWLIHIAAAYDAPEWVAAGGPNLPPPPRNSTEACVALAPGAPAHVLLNDIEAEHLPGCNLSIRKSALQAIGGFREQFMVAGDDVDVCWRLNAAGGKLRFVPSAVVWHHRRFTVDAYFRQQRGYGHAESLLIRDYPKRFAWFSGARWRGIIYGDEFIHAPLSLQHIHYGELGSSPFQCIYSGTSMGTSTFFIGLPWVIFTSVILAIGFLSQNFWITAIGCIALLLWSISTYYRYHQIYKENAGLSLKLRVLLLYMQVSQPLVRDWARTRGLLRHSSRPFAKVPWAALGKHWFQKSFLIRLKPVHKFWSESNLDRNWLLERLIQQAETIPLEVSTAGAWEAADLNLRAHDLSLKLYSVSEYHGDGKVLTKLQLAYEVKYWHGLLVFGLIGGALPSTFSFLGWLILATLVLMIFIWKSVSFYNDFRFAICKATQDSDLHLLP